MSFKISNRQFNICNEVPVRVVIINKLLNLLSDLEESLCGSCSILPSLCGTMLSDTENCCSKSFPLSSNGITVAGISSWTFCKSTLILVKFV